MTTPQRTEPVKFKENQKVPNGRGGSITSLAVVHTALMRWEPLKGSRLLEASQESLREGIKLTGWVNKAYTPKTGSIVEVNGQDWVIQQLQYLDQQRRQYQIIALQPAFSNG